MTQSERIPRGQWQSVTLRLSEEVSGPEGGLSVQRRTVAVAVGGLWHYDILNWKETTALFGVSSITRDSWLGACVIRQNIVEHLQSAHSVETGWILRIKNNLAPCVSFWPCDTWAPEELRSCWSLTTKTTKRKTTTTAPPPSFRET